jgi:hypothetical protein
MGSTLTVSRSQGSRDDRERSQARTRHRAEQNTASARRRTPAHTTTPHPGQRAHADIRAHRADACCSNHAAASAEITAAAGISRRSARLRAR